ncbi:MAG: DUF1552 domain-containing protein, partial [Myxococcota bacterium]
MSAKYSRRDFTFGLGTALIAAPFLRILQQPAFAATSQKAQRLIVFFTPNGTIHRYWRPRGSGTSFTIPSNSILSPLQTHRKDILVLDGLDFYGADNHSGGMKAMLTGGGLGSSESQGMSIDQYVAKHISKAKGQKSSLEFGVQTSPWGGQQQTRMSYISPTKYVDPDDKPLNVYKRLWRATPNAPGNSNSTFNPQKSALDATKDELRALRKALGQEERYKLDQHLQEFQESEQRLLGNTGGASTPTASCKRPLSPAAADPLKHENFPAVGKAQMDMMVMALSCGLTNVASIQWSHTVGPQ